MSDIQPREVAGADGPATLLRAALPSIPGVNQVPGVRKHSGDFAGLSMRRRGVTIDRSRVEEYATVCGFPIKDTAPLPFPHLLAFPLHLAIMADPAFPYPAIGTVHIENVITSHRPLAIGETLAVTVAARPPRPHRKGRTIDFEASVTVDDEVVWESVSTYLRRGKGDDAAPRDDLDLGDPPPGVARWRLPADLGRQYAAVSGDRNPIHLHPLTSRPLGFARPIAHGMWTKARCIAALENRLPDAVRIEVAFKRPIMLPGSVSFGARHDADGYVFGVTKSGKDTVHLVGRTSDPD